MNEIELTVPLTGRFRIESKNICEIELFEGLFSGVIIRQDIHPRNLYFFRIGGGPALRSTLEWFNFAFVNHKGQWWLDFKARQDWKRWKEKENKNS